MNYWMGCLQNLSACEFKAGTKPETLSFLAQWCGTKMVPTSPNARVKGAQQILLHSSPASGTKKQPDLGPELQGFRKGGFAHSTEDRRAGIEAFGLIGSHKMSWACSQGPWEITTTNHLPGHCRAGHNLEKEKQEVLVSKAGDLAPTQASKTVTLGLSIRTDRPKKQGQVVTWLLTLKPHMGYFNSVLHLSNLRVNPFLIWAVIIG